MVMIKVFPAIIYNPDIEQLREWYREHRGTEEFQACLVRELITRERLRNEREETA